MRASPKYESTPRALNPALLTTVAALAATLVSSAFASAFVVGCGRGESAEERQMSQLREEITRVQTDRDRFEQRVNALELQASDTQQKGKVGAGLATDATPTPKLRVITLSPDGSEESTTSGETASDGAKITVGNSGVSGEDPDDGTPRPTIRVRGAANHGAGRGGADEHIEQTLPDDSAGGIGGRGGSGGHANEASVQMSSALNPAAQRAYDDALALVNTRQFGPALDAFAAFLVKYPDHPNADNATYWRGECYFAQQDYMRAAEQFEGVLARFPLGNKVPDALLKAGMTQQKLGNAAKARTYFDKLLQQYPRSEAARRIPEKS